MFGHWFINGLFIVAQQENIPDSEPCSLILYRNQQHHVHFMQSNPLTLVLLQRLQQNQHQTGHEIFTKLAQDLQTDALTLNEALDRYYQSICSCGYFIGVHY